MDGKRETGGKKPCFALYVELLGCWLPERGKMGLEVEAQRHWHPSRVDASLSWAWREVGEGGGLAAAWLSHQCLPLGSKSSWDTVR